MAEPVTVANFIRAETGRMFASLQNEAGGVNRFNHRREPTSVGHQPVVRMNRDTLYSSAIVDISAGATITLPDAGDRYLSAMVVNEDHYINRILHEPGEHTLTVDEFGTPCVAVATRILVDPAQAEDVATVNALQDALRVDAGSASPFVLPDYDQESFDETRQAIAGLAKHLGGFTGAFGPRAEVDPVRHLVGTAVGWGGLPQSEAIYLGVDPELPVGEYTLTVGDVPVDGFWSVSVYNADGFFEPNDRNAYSVNNITADRNDDGTVTIHFGGDGDKPNLLPIMEGWNYTVRLYRPRPEAIDGSWTFPTIAT